jgi:hypothetical protein
MATEMLNPNPNCEREDCRFEYGAGMSTCMMWYPAYDKQGNLVSVDPNTYSRDVFCTTCSKRWTIRTQYGKTEIIET